MLTKDIVTHTKDMAYKDILNTFPTIHMTQFIILSITIEYITLCIMFIMAIMTLCMMFTCLSMRYNTTKVVKAVVVAMEELVMVVVVVVVMGIAVVDLMDMLVMEVDVGEYLGEEKEKQ